MKVFGYFFLLLVIVLGVTFAILNATPVSVHYYLGTAQIALSLVIVCSLFIGFLIGFFMMFLVVLRLKSEKRRLKKRLKVTEQEIENLRAIPLKDDH
ncbi:MAG: LapA family protein [Pseudomonadota bacterium]